jgi:hypothetical protein
MKNKTSESKNTFEKINRILAENGVSKIMYDYGTDGLLVGLTFAIRIGDNDVGFRMPAMVDSVFAILYPKANEHRYRKYAKSWKEQAYRTAWANIRDWIDAQMALVATKQAKVEQVFLPYLIVDGNRTLYEQIDESKFKLLN